MATAGFLGIDAGTQGLSVVFTDTSLRVLGTGEGSYEMCLGLGEGCYEQNPADWIKALGAALADLRKQFNEPLDVLAIGISGQMHGEVLIGPNQVPLKPARLWCDARNEEEGHELTAALDVKMPKRITAARWLWTLRHQPDVAAETIRLTTPAGWIAAYLTGEFYLGVGEASGMFPIDQETMDYDQQRLAAYDRIARAAGAKRDLVEMLPRVSVAGEVGGQVSSTAAAEFGLAAGTPVAPAEGDQPASLAGSLIGKSGTVSVSFGTSVCANSVGDRAFRGVSDAVDHFCAPDGKPINMVWLRNGTTYMNTIVEMFGKAMSGDRGQAFEQIMPEVVKAAPDCRGLLALPFMDDEPGLGVSEGGTAMLVGFNASNAEPAYAVKAALLATMFNLRRGSEVLDEQGYPRNELVLSGGLTRTPELAQLLADVMKTPVRLLSGADEGCAWGAALLAKYRYQQDRPAWSQFLDQHRSEQDTRFEPEPEATAVYDRVYERYEALVQRMTA